MGEIPAAAKARFAKLAIQLAAGDGAETAHREGFGTGSLFVGRKMFAVLDATGALVLKLPPARVQELIAAGVGSPWHPGTGAPLKEYVALGVRAQAKWLALAKESRSHMGTGH
ncbi:MAG: MmcQ/YjbR family DNA-binding protein [Thermoplasmata archaeon]|nr:MmcQ/YjbR family DNA-binding protein [Thermoplasmata archaeon]